MVARAEGETVLDFTILASGVISRAAIVHSAGADAAHLALDRAAFDAFASCAVWPALDAKGHAVDYSGQITYRWKLER
jgi:TonB family protein